MKKHNMKCFARLCMVLTAMYLLYGCGTSHHFLAPRPLESNEFMGSISWHFDLNRLYLPNLVPDLNVYGGMGGNTNWGTGFNIATFSITHLSAAHYWSVAGDDQALAFVHINQLLGSSNNPYFELGGGYVFFDGSTTHNISAGMALGNGVVSPLMLMNEKNPNFVPRDKRFRLIPFAKYVVSGQDVGLSLSYYHGITNLALDVISEQAEKVTAPLYTWSADEVDSIQTIHDSTLQAGREVVGVFLSSGDTVILYHPFMDPLPFVLPLMALNEWHFGRSFFDKSEQTFTIFGEARQQIRVNIDSLQSTLRNGDTIKLRRYPETILERISEKKKSVRWWHDISISGARIIYEKD